MNWKQLHTSATPEERLELLTHMLRAVEARQQRVVFTGQQWLRNRRQGYQAHFLNDRRRHTRARTVSLITFAVVLFTVSIATMAVAIQAPLHIGGPVVFFYATSVMGVVAFKPRQIRLSPVLEQKF